MLKILKGAVLITALAGVSAPVLAAREFTPQPGLWMVPAENNGLPGRGFSIDVQGNTVFMQVFNYDKSGAATFHTALGQLDDNASMTVPLLRFKNGPYFGGPAREGVEDGSAGHVTVRFTDGLHGSVQFPGEEETPISRFLVNEGQPFWWTQVSDTPPSGKEGGQIMRWTTTPQDGARYAWSAELNADEQRDGVYSLELATPIYGPVNRQFFDCREVTGTPVLDCSVTSTTGVPTLDIQRIRFRSFGPDVVGEIQPAGDPTQRLTLNGWTEATYSCNGVHCNSGALRSARIYADSDILYGVCITGYCSGYDNITVLPTSGAWMIDEERTGKPGRGVFLDVQDNTIIVQTSDYLDNGAATFHLGAAALNYGPGWTDTTASTVMLRFADGRYFGGPAQSGKEVARAGAAALTFPAQIGERKTLTDFATGSVALPGEAPKALRRLQFAPPRDTGLEHMLGEYLVTWETTGTPYYQEGWIQLSRVEGDRVKNQDGTVQCLQRDRSKPYSISCTWNEKPDAPFDPVIGLIGHTDIGIDPFNHHHTHHRTLLHTRDQEGNWLGLGKVNVPGLSIPED